MNQEAKDKEWQRLQFRIDQMFGKYFKNEMQTIEYKPENIVHLLDVPLEYRAKRPETA